MQSSKQRTLLLEDAAEVAVRGAELGHEPDGRHVAVDGLLDVPLVDHRVACMGGDGGGWVSSER